MREVDINEDDIPAEEEAKSKGSWFPCKNEDCRRKKSACKQKIKRKKKIISLGRMYCDLFFYYSILIGLLMSDMVYLMKRPDGHNGVPGGYTLIKGRMAMMGCPVGIS